MNKIGFNQVFFQIIGDCFKLEEEHRKKLNLNLSIDTINSWSKYLHGLVNLPYMLEEELGIEFNEDEYEILCTSTLSVWYTKVIRKMEKKKLLTGTLLEK